MIIWIFAAGIGLVLSLSGLMVLFRKYRRGEITGLYLLAIIAGFCSFVSYALASAIRPEFTSGPVTVILLLPAFLAVVVVVRIRRKTG